MTTPTSRTAIVTGASRGIGQAIAVALGGAGFNVTINYHSSPDAAQQTAERVESAGGRAHVVQADIGSSADHQKLLDETVQKFGAVTLLVNNAGVGPKVRADMLELVEENYDWVLNTNLKGPFFLSQRIANHMVAQRAGYPQDLRPAIVNIGSISAYTASTNRAEYCLAKAGMAMMSQLFAARLAEHEINVYEIRPGIIATDMTSADAVRARYDKLIFEGDLLPLKRWGRPEDVARAVLAVASDLLPYSTGQVIDVDGGFHLRRL